MNGWFAHDATFEASSPGLVLRLDQGEQLGWRMRQSQSSWDDLLQRYETDIDDDQIGRALQSRRRERTDIGLFETNDLLARAQSCMQLAVTHIDRIDACRAARKQHISKAPGRGADIKAYPARGIEAEIVQCGQKLQPTTRHPGMRRGGRELSLDRKSFGWLGNHHAVCGHQTGRNSRLGLGATCEQASFKQQSIGPHTIHDCCSRHGNGQSALVGSTFGGPNGQSMRG